MTITKTLDQLWEHFPFNNCSFSIGQMEYQLDSIFTRLAMTHGTYFKRHTLHSFESK